MKQLYKQYIESNRNSIKFFLSTQTKSGFKYYSLSFYNRALVLFIKKKNNSLKLYIDYHRLNKITYKDYYSISLVANLLDTPKKTRYYTKINLRNAYYLIYIAKRKKWKIAFHIYYSFFKQLIIFFGLSNTLSAFQRLMNEIFIDLLDIYIVIYLNNILSYFDNLKNYKKYIKKVIKK